MGGFWLEDGISHRSPETGDSKRSLIQYIEQVEEIRKGGIVEIARRSELTIFENKGRLMILCVVLQQ
jgi:hypothetical protein